MNKDGESISFGIGLGWWLVLFALPIFFTAIVVMEIKAIPSLFIFFGVFLLGIFSPLNKKLKPSKNRELVYQVIKIQVIAGGMPIAASIALQMPSDSIAALYLGTLMVMVFAVVYRIFDKE